MKDLFSWCGALTSFLVLLLSGELPPITNPATETHLCLVASTCSQAVRSHVALLINVWRSLTGSLAASVDIVNVNSPQGRRSLASSHCLIISAPSLYWICHFEGLSAGPSLMFNSIDLTLIISGLAFSNRPCQPPLILFLLRAGCFMAGSMSKANMHLLLTSDLGGLICQLVLVNKASPSPVGWSVSPKRC